MKNEKELALKERIEKSDKLKACKTCKYSRPDCDEYPSPEGNFCHGFSLKLKNE